jgi:hypothetical protein
MLKLPDDNVNTLPRSASKVKTTLSFSRLTAREYGSALGMPSETTEAGIAGQVSCCPLSGATLELEGSGVDTYLSGPRDRLAAVSGLTNLQYGKYRGLRFEAEKRGERT